MEPYCRRIAVLLFFFAVLLGGSSSGLFSQSVTGEARADEKLREFSQKEKKEEKEDRREREDEREKSNKKQLIPFLECIRKDDSKSFTAFFGYTNPRTSVSNIAIGLQNRFTPPPDSQGQPIVFNPGTHHYVFSVSSPGNAIVWNLTNNVAVANKNSKPVCQAVCGNGVIEPGEECDDGNLNNGDSCNDKCESGSCRQDSDCNDGIFCNGTESCVNHSCVNGAPIVCNNIDNNPCTNELCDNQQQGCISVQIPNCFYCMMDAECDDGKFCNGTEVCINGACQNGLPPSCPDDHNPCTNEVCDDSVNGCISNAVPSCSSCQTDGECDDGKFCNGTEKCINGSCQSGVSPVCPDDQNPCTTEKCDPNTNGCVSTPDPSCNECINDTQCAVKNDACHQFTCVNNQCQETSTVGCISSDPCMTASCDPTQGCITTPIPNCNACNDNSQCADKNDACHQFTCVNNQCQETSTVGCISSDPCMTASCDPTQGCVTTPIPNCNACNDNSQCADKNDACHQFTCLNNECQLSSTIACADLNPCTADSCDPKIGCKFEPIPNCNGCNSDSDCSYRNDACTTYQCLNNTCQIASQTGCASTNPCMAASCDPTQGCVSTPIPGCDSCNSNSDCNYRNDACTTYQCLNNACQIASQTGCASTNPCMTASCDPTQGCVTTPIPDCNSCNSNSDCSYRNDACTTYQCLNNTCQIASQTGCASLDPCMVGSCDPVKGCVFTPIQNCGP